MTFDLQYTDSKSNARAGLITTDHGQIATDGLGEGFEQQPIDTMDGELFVSFWNSGDDYAMMTESEFDEYRQQNEMQMGGM